MLRKIITIIIIIYTPVFAIAQAALRYNGKTYSNINDLRSVFLSDVLNNLIKIDDDHVLKNTRFPESWSKESAIVLARKDLFTNITSVNSIYIRPTCYMLHRQRILLNDYKAVINYSNYSFNSSEACKISIIKKNKQVVNVDLKEAVELSFTSSNKFIDKYFGYKKKKIAFKNLEVGDVIDFTALYASYDNSIQNIFTPSKVSLNTAVYKYEICVKDLNFIYSPFNGAKALNEGKIKDVKSFYYQDSSLAAFEDEPLMYDGIHLPNYKYVIAPTYVKHFNKKIAKNGLLSIKESDIKNYVNENFKDLKRRQTPYNFEVYNKLKNSGSEMEICKEYINQIRDNRLLKDLFHNNLDNITNAYSPWHLPLLFNKYKKDFSIIITTDKNECKLENVFFENELYLGTKFRSAKGTQYLFTVSAFHDINYITSYIDGNDAYEMEFKKGKNSNIKKFKLDSTQHDNNVYKTLVNARIDQSFDTVVLNNHVILSGYQRIDNYNYGKNIDVIHSKYLARANEVNKGSTDNVYLFSEKLYEKMPTSDVLKYDKIAIKNASENMKRYVLQELKKMYRSEYDFYSISKHEPIKDGIANSDRTIEWVDEIKVGSLASSSNNELVISVGKFLGDLNNVTDEKLRENRKYDFMISNNKTLDLNLTLEMPEGYIASGIQHLNKSFKNHIGAFSSSAEINGNVLKLKIVKQYNKGSYTINDWKDYLAFTDAGVSFLNSKLILFKK